MHSTVYNLCSLFRLEIIVTLEGIVHSTVYNLCSLFRLEIIVTLEGIVEPSGNTTQVNSTFNRAHNSAQQSCSQQRATILLTTESENLTDPGLKFTLIPLYRAVTISKINFDFFPPCSVVIIDH